MPVIPLPGITPTPGMGDGFGPCEAWEPIHCVPLPTGSEAISGWALDMATEILWARTGMRYDQCAITIRPCQSACFGGTWPFGGFWWEVGGLYPQPALINGNWYNLTCGSCSGGCSCSIVHEIVLPGGPVTSIAQVKVDGVVLPSSAYRLDDWRQLVRLDGESWPVCNNLNLEDTQEGTWSVTPVYGQPLPVAGRFAVGELMRQLVLACMGDDCDLLPYNVSQINRQGVALKFPDLNAIFSVDKDGRSSNRIGLQFCDLFIDAANPAGIRSKARTYNVDVANPRITGV